MSANATTANDESLRDKNPRAALRTSALLWALLLGAVADAILRVEGRPGLNIGLWALAGVAVLAMLLKRRDAPASAETWWLVGGALCFALDLMVRDADALAVFSLLAAVTLLGLAAGRATSAWVTRAQVSDVVFAAVRVGVLCAAGPIGWGRSEGDADTSRSGWMRTVRTGVRGALMALPALLLLGALLMSADPVFERLVHDTFRVDLDAMLQHVVFTAFIAWATAGFLRAFLVPDRDVMDRLRVPQPVLAPAEVSVALWTLNLMFLAFMLVQVRYLFGGADLVQLTPGLSYAEYARRGFFELVATTVLVVPILLAADWATAREHTSARRVLRGTMLVLVGLLLGVIASAAYRMRLYQGAYGLTEQRLYVSVVIAWLTMVLLVFVATVLLGRRERFVVASIGAAAVCLVALYALNPHAVIARVNLARAATGADVDSAYLQSLSADAVPTMLAHLEDLPAVERCTVSTMLTERWTGERRGGWRTWNLSDWRARRLVRRRMSPDTNVVRCSQVADLAS